MRKVLFYINAIHHGGAEKVLVNLANNCAATHYKTIVVTSFIDREEYTLSSEVERLSLEKYNLGKSFLNRNIARTIGLRKICKKEKPDIVISFMGEANFRAILATRFLRIPTLISVRNDPDKEYENFLMKVLAKALFRLADGCVFQTEEAKNWFPNQIKKKSRIILNQVDEKFFGTPYVGERKDIVTVGRLEPQKNHRLLIRAFYRIAKRHQDVNLIIYGDGSLYTELSRYVEKLRLQERIKLKGAAMDIQEKIYDAKLFVLSSDYEGLPNAVMEAMTLGIPVISTDCPCGGPRLLLQNNEYGILVPMKDEIAMARAMDQVLKDTKLANELSQKGKLRSLAFEPKVVFKEWNEYINEIIDYNRSKKM